MNVEDYTKKYYANNAKRLRVVVDQIIKRFGGITDPDDFYSLANEVFVDVIVRYDDRGNFDSFLYSCLDRKIRTEMTRRNRDKRKKYARDKDGKKVIGDDGKPVITPDVCIDAPIDDSGTTYADILQVREVRRDVRQDDAIERYKESLSPKQRQIAEYLGQGFKPVEICKIMNITEERYTILFEQMSSFDKTLNLKEFRRRNKCSQ